MLSQFVGFLFTTYNIQLTVIFQAKKKKKKKNHLSDSTKNNNRLYKLLVNVSEMNPRVGFFLLVFALGLPHQNVSSLKSSAKFDPISLLFFFSLCV